jgi:hypothetical protein
MFNVILVSDGTVICTHENGRDAALTAEALNESYRHDGIAERVRVARAVAAVDDSWKLREQARLDNGTYKRLPWASCEWVIADHFAHVSEVDDTLIAYTRDAVHGAADRQLRVRPGRYLEQHYRNVLSQDDIRHWCAVFDREQGRGELLFADTADEIQSVYESGPKSCMSESAADYDSKIHPTRVYAAGDLGVAYMKDEERVTARALVWAERKIYGRMYGDENRLEALLKEAGFERGDDARDWEGARLLRIQQDHRFVAPYLDHPMDSVSDDGTHLIVSSYGYICCRDTEGLSEPVCTCDYCGEAMNQDESYSVRDEQWCEDCVNNHCFYCRGCEEYCHNDNYAGRRNDNDALCDSCARQYTRCESCEYLCEDIIETVEGNSYCQDCASNELETTPCEEYAQSVDSCKCVICEDSRKQVEMEI